MSEARSLPAAPGDRIRSAPYVLSLRTQHACKAWRTVAAPYWPAAKAWRDELAGRFAASGRVADFATWRRLRQGQPSNFDAYRFAAIQLLKAWAPDSTELREQMRLAAALAGVPDPAHAPPLAHPSDIPDTPEAMLGLMYQSSLGLWLADQKRARAAP